MFAHSPAATGAAVQASAACSDHVGPSSRRNTPDILAVAEAALASGAEALTLTNTLLAIAIDTNGGHLSSEAGGGGLSGDALHSVALRASTTAGGVPDAGIVGVAV